MSLLKFLDEDKEIICMTGLQKALMELSSCLRVKKQKGHTCLSLIHEIKTTKLCKNCNAYRESKRK